VIVREQAQQQLRVAPIMFLSPRLGGANRGRMAHAARDAQLLHQPHEPTHRSRGFDPNDDGRGQGLIKRPDRLAVVRQRVLADFPGLAIQHGNGLLARM
jgi:hypothetical protein